MNLTQVSEFARTVKEKERQCEEKIKACQKQELLIKIGHQTTIQTQKTLAQELDLKLQTKIHTRTQKDKSVRIELTLSKEQFENLKKCQDLLSHAHLKQNQALDLVSVIDSLATRDLKSKMGKGFAESRANFDLNFPTEAGAEFNADSDSIFQSNFVSDADSGSNAGSVRKLKQPTPTALASKRSVVRPGSPQKRKITSTVEVAMTTSTSRTAEKKSSASPTVTAGCSSAARSDFSFDPASRAKFDRNLAPASAIITSAHPASLSPAPFSSNSEASSTSRSAALKISIRKAVLPRDRVCQFQDPRTGKVCGSCFGLEVDHIHPRGDGDELSNLQVLCSTHNQLRYSEQARIKKKSEFYHR